MFLGPSEPLYLHRMDVSLGEDKDRRGAMGGGSHTRRLILVLVLVASLAVQPKVVCSLSSVDHVLRRNARDATAVVGFDAKKSLEGIPPEPSDPNKMSERRVRRGSDPIHNRC